MTLFRRYKARRILRATGITLTPEEMGLVVSPYSPWGPLSIIPCPDIARDKTDRTAYRAYNDLRNLYILCRWHGVKTCAVNTCCRPAERMDPDDPITQEMDRTDP